MRRKKTKKRKRKRRSGNHTWSPQWLYIYWNFPFVWIIKIGITGRSLKTRRKEVDRSAPGWDIPIFALYLYGAYYCEQTIHQACTLLKVGFWGSGRTERFHILALIPALFISIVWFIIYWAGVIALGLIFYYIIAKLY